MKARGGIALAIKAQRRAVESHEVETTESLFCVSAGKGQRIQTCLVGARKSLGTTRSDAGQTLGAGPSDKRGKISKVARVRLWTAKEKERRKRHSLERISKQEPRNTALGQMT